MAGVPLTLNKFKKEEFEAWLLDCKAHVLAPTNPYEVLRYKTRGVANAKATHVVYRKENGNITYTGDSRSHYWAFKSGKSQDLYVGASAKQAKAKQARTPKKHRAGVGNGNQRSKEVVKMLERDGELCFACHKPLGDDITREHLLPKSLKAGESLHNKVLMHQECNQRLADLPLGHKIDLIITMRGV